MSKRVLSIVTTGYRGTIEEQDDAVLWLIAMCANAGLDVSLLLEASAVNYLARGQDAGGLRFGDMEVAHPPVMQRDLEDLIAKGIEVGYVREDLIELGIDPTQIIDGTVPVARADLPVVFARHDQVWRW
jgi:hypothetical protein